MKKRSIVKIASTLLIICGILLVLGAAALFVKVSNDDAKAKAFSQEIVSRLKDETPEAATSLRRQKNQLTPEKAPKSAS